MATKYVEAVLSKCEIRQKRRVTTQDNKSVEVISVIVPGRFEALVDVKNPEGLIVDPGDVADLKVNVGFYGDQLTFKLLSLA